MLDNQQETQFEEIHLRTGYSKGPCLDCVYADFRNKNEKNEVYCEIYGYYKYPPNVNTCFHFKEIKY